MELKDKMLEAIKSNDNYFNVGGGEVTLRIEPNELDAAAESCAKIAEDFAMEFAEWIEDVNSPVFPGDSFSELLNKFKQQKK